MLYSPAFIFSSVYSLGFYRVPGFALGRCAVFKPFWPLALVQQALPAIILAALRRSRGPALFPGPHPSLSLGAPFWPSGLTIRRSRPPTAAAELRALAPQKTNLFRPCLFKRHSIFQALFSAGFVVFPGFACWRYAGFWSFWPLALVQQAPAAIFFVVLRSLGGAALFRSSCPSPNPSYRFWLLALTFRSSRPAFCGRLTSPVSLLFIPAHFSP